MPRLRRRDLYATIGVRIGQRHHRTCHPFARRAILERRGLCEVGQLDLDVLCDQQLMEGFGVLFGLLAAARVCKRHSLAENVTCKRVRLVLFLRVPRRHLNGWRARLRIGTPQVFFQKRGRDGGELAHTSSTSVCFSVLGVSSIMRVMSAVLRC